MQFWATSPPPAGRGTSRQTSPVGLQVGGIHAGEAPQVSLEPRAQVVDHFHGVEVGGVGGVGLVGLRSALPLGDHAVVGALLVMDDGAALREAAHSAAFIPLVVGHHRDVPCRGVDTAHRGRQRDPVGRGDVGRHGFEPNREGVQVRR